VFVKPEEADGHRILVDRLWARGLSKKKAKVGPKGSSPHQVGKNSNDCHRVTENTEVLAACRYTAPAKDANGCREGTGHMSTDKRR